MIALNSMTTRGRTILLRCIVRFPQAGVFYNTGHGHLGWTLSAATAEMVAEAAEQARSTGDAAQIYAPRLFADARRTHLIATRDLNHCSVMMILYQACVRPP